MADTPSGSRKEHRREPSDCCPTERGSCPYNPPCCNGGRLQQIELDTQWRPAARDSTLWMGRAFTIRCARFREYVSAARERTLDRMGHPPVSYPFYLVDDPFSVGQGHRPGRVAR